MAVRIPNGATVFLAATYGVRKSMTALTNANPGVATLEASHGVVAGDFLELTSGYSRINNRIVKSGTVSTNDVPLLGMNTTSTSTFPVGGGTGSVREIASWTQLQQILTTGSDGGQQQFLPYQFLEDDDEKRIPTNKSASGMTMSVADDDTLAGFVIAQTANEDRQPRAVKIVLVDGAVILLNAFISVGAPSLTVNQLMACEVTLSQLAPIVRYAAP